MKVLQVTVGFRSWGVLESHENLKNVNIVAYGREILPCHLNRDTCLPCCHGNCRCIQILFCFLTHVA